MPIGILGNCMFERLKIGNRGATLPEYALISAIIGLASIASVGYYGNQANETFTDAGAAFGSGGTNGFTDGQHDAPKAPNGGD